MVACRACGENNPARARFCLNCAASLGSVAPTHDVRKIVTVLFTDVSGSTALGERLDPESVRALMSRYFATIRRVIEAHGGTVEKFIGDAVMAVFGIPVVHEDDALRAVRAAVQIQESIVALNAEPQARGGPLEFRTGLNTGEVVAGDASVGQTLVTGDAVNTAARLEQAATPGETLIGEATYHLVRDAVAVEAVRPIVARGKSAPIRAYRLLEVTGGAGHVRRLDTPMVGRQPELDYLQHAYAKTVDERSCRVVTVLGAAGVGKSRLVAEFLAGLGERPHVLEGRCPSYGEGITYLPLAEVVRVAAAIDESDTPLTAGLKIDAMLGVGSDSKSAAIAIRSAIGLSTEAAPQEEIFWATRKFLDHLASASSLVVVFDDIHWAEATFLDLIENIVDHSRDAPLFILCPARPELIDGRPTWGQGRANAMNVVLEPLPVDASDRLIGLLPGGASLPGAIRDRILLAAEGNPLYLEEMLSMLVDEGQLVRGNEGWTAAPELERLKVPPTIQALLAARLEQLSPTERAAAQRASIAGRVFELAAVIELTSDELRSGVAPALAGLGHKNFIRSEHSPTPGTFSFRHILIRDGAYDALPKSERASLHERFATWLEGKAAESLSQLDEIAGYHFEQAWRYRGELGFIDETTERIGAAATDHLASAAFGALERSDLRGASQLLGRALLTMPHEDPRLVELTVERVDVLILLGSLREAEAVLQEVRDMPTVRTDPRQRAWWELAHLRMAVEAGAGYEVAAASSVTHRAILAFEGSNDIRGLCYASLSEAHVYWWQLQAASTFAALERALAFSRQAGRRSQELFILGSLAQTCWAGPSPVPDVLAQLEGIRQAADGHRRIEAVIHQSRAKLFGMAGRRVDAERDLDAALLTYAELGIAVSVGETGEAGYWLGLGTGDLERERRRLEDGNRELEVAHANALLSTTLGLLAFVLLDLGKADEAEETARRGLAISSADDVAAVVTLRMAIASLDAQRGREREAVGVADELIEIFAASDLHAIVGDWLSRAAQIHLAAGNRERAAALFGDALQRYRLKKATGLATVLEHRMESLGMGLSPDA